MRCFSVLSICLRDWGKPFLQSCSQCCASLQRIQVALRLSLARFLQLKDCSSLQLSLTNSVPPLPLRPKVSCCAIMFCLVLEEFADVHHLNWPASMLLYFIVKVIFSGCLFEHGLSLVCTERLSFLICCSRISPRGRHYCPQGPQFVWQRVSVCLRKVSSVGKGFHCSTELFQVPGDEVIGLIQALKWPLWLQMILCLKMRHLHQMCAQFIWQILLSVLQFCPHLSYLDEI